MKYYLNALANYATFKGRASRKEYWMFVLFSTIFMIVSIFLDNLLGTNLIFYDQRSVYGYIYLLYTFAIMIPGLALCVRRLHDINKSGWNYFLAFIPLIGGVWLLILLCTKGMPEENKYGAMSIID